MNRKKRNNLVNNYPLRYSPEDRELWQAAADRDRLPLAAWIRMALNERARSEGQT